MTALARAKAWWQHYTGEEETPLDGDTPAWAVSLVVHVAVLVGMALVMIPMPPKSTPAISIVQSPVEDVLLVDPQELAVSLDEQPAVGAESTDSLDAAEAVAAVLAEESVVSVEAPDIPDSDITIEPVLDVLATGLALSDSLVVKGDTAVGTTGASGAVDRLTMEIQASLEQRDTIVCWVFDQSVSLAGQRREIASRLERVFDELGVTGRAPGRAELFNLIYAYGKETKPIVDKPTKDVSQVVKAIESIPIDESGLEMTFTAIGQVATRAKDVRGSSRSRNVMIIVFTDEVGNDEPLCDQVAAFCRTQKMPVYVVGVPAPFGRRQVEMKFVEFDDRFADDVRWPVVDQGPETLHPEVVRIKMGNELDDPIDSGFGPFSLSKLCAETGGIYFAVHANRNVAGRLRDAATAPMASRLRYFFDPDVMRAYRPDYVAAATLEKSIVANRAKQALVNAAKMSELSPMESPKRTFPREDDGKLALLFSEAQKAAAQLQPKIDMLHTTLAAGEPDRPKIEERRWQAGYDLALGRVLAFKVRNFGYNQMLGNAKSGKKFENPKNDTWELVPSDDLTGLDSPTKKQAEQAKTYLQRVVQDHPGTPWALIAEQELRTPLGHAWRETFTGVNSRQMDGNGGNAMPSDDASRKLAPPKPSRPLKNL
jgi:hypothetical protein